MDSDQMTADSRDFAERGLQYTKDQLGDMLSQTEEFVRANPTRALCYGVAAGFILDRLPIFRILGAFLRLFLMAFKPAILIYGAMKLYQTTKEEV